MEKKEYKFVDVVRVKKTSSITYVCDNCGRRIGTKSFDFDNCTHIKKRVQFYRVYSSDSDGAHEQSDYCIDCIASVFTKFLDSKDEFANCYEFDVEFREIDDIGGDTSF